MKMHWTESDTQFPPVLNTRTANHSYISCMVSLRGPLRIVSVSPLLPSETYHIYLLTFSQASPGPHS